MGPGIPELKNRVTDYDVVKPSQVKLWRLSNSNLSLIFLNSEFLINKISEFRNSEILSLFNNIKIPELRNSRI